MYANHCPTNCIVLKWTDPKTLNPKPSKPSQASFPMHSDQLRRGETSRLFDYDSLTAGCCSDQWPVWEQCGRCGQKKLAPDECAWACGHVAYFLHPEVSWRGPIRGLGSAGVRGQEDKPREAGSQLSTAISSLLVVSDISGLNAGWRMDCSAMPANSNEPFSHFPIWRSSFWLQQVSLISRHYPALCFALGSGYACVGGFEVTEIT